LSRKLANVVKLLGSTMREIGVLVLVFAPLETFLRELTPSKPVVSLMSGSLILITLGIMLEVEG
jgi:hypothetical protein